MREILVHNAFALSRYMTYFIYYSNLQLLLEIRTVHIYKVICLKHDWFAVQSCSTRTVPLRCASGRVNALAMLISDSATSHA